MNQDIERGRIAGPQTHGQAPDAHDADARRVADYLRALPSALPPPALGVRILARAQARRRWRRYAPPLALAAAAALLMVLPVREQAVAPALPPSAADPVVLAELRALDRELQAAYAHGSQERIDTLWLARTALARRVDEPAAGGRVVRL